MIYKKNAYQQFAPDGSSQVPFGSSFEPERLPTPDTATGRQLAFPAVRPGSSDWLLASSPVSDVVVGYRKEEDRVASPSPAWSLPTRPLKIPDLARPLTLRRRRGLIVFCMLGLLLVIGLSSFVLVHSLSTEHDVTVYQVPSKQALQYIGGGGIVYPRQQLDVSYPFAERVVAVMVKAGDLVTLNQALIQLDPRQLNAQVQQAADELSAASAYLNSVSSTGNAVSIAQAQQQYNLAKSRYNALVAQTSSPFLHKGNLVSPLSGVITAVNINAGEVFTADTALLTIMDESSVIVHVKVPLTNLEQVRRGQSAQITPSALPDLTFTGTVISLIPQADPQTDTFEVWVEIKENKQQLLPGMSVFVRIQEPTRAILVPRLAVLDEAQVPLVFVVRNQHAYLRSIHVFGRTPTQLLVDRGLQSGALVVLIGLDRLLDGQAIQVVGFEGQ